MSAFPSFDPNDFLDQAIMREQIPSVTRQKLAYDESMSLEDQRAELWKTFEDTPKVMNFMSHDYNSYSNDLDQDYFPRQQLWRERGFSGFENDPIYREIFVELEYLIEEVIGAQRIKEKKMDMYKGTTKKWQILDDKAFDREEIIKLQVAAKAPLPEELEMWEDKHSQPMQLPVNNTNVSNWRDEARAIDGLGADFDPKFLDYDREKKKKFFLERYEKPAELTE